MQEELFRSSSNRSLYNKICNALAIEREGIIRTFSIISYLSFHNYSHRVNVVKEIRCEALTLYKHNFRMHYNYLKRYLFQKETEKKSVLWHEFFSVRSLG